MKKNFAVLAAVVLFSCASMTSFHPGYGMTRFGQTGMSSFENLEGQWVTESFVLVPIKWGPEVGVQICRTSKNLGGDRYALDFYSFVMKYQGTGWRFLDGMDIDINGAIYKLKDPSPSRTIISGGNVREHLIMAAPEEMAEAIKDMTSVRIKIPGQRGVIELSPDEIAALRHWIAAD